MGTVQDFLSAATSRLGTPYVWGGDSPQTGFDCSGLVYWAAQQAGAPIPARTTWQMMEMLPRVQSPKAGDLVILDGGGHVGICLDDGCSTMIDAPNSSSVVRTEKVAGWGPVQGYYEVPGLTGSASKRDTASYLNASDPIGGLEGLAGDVISKAEGVASIPGQVITDAFASLPALMLKAFFGNDMTAGQLMIRAIEVLGGGIILIGGTVMFAMAFSNSSSGDDGSATYRAVASQVRAVQHAKDLREQRQRGVERRANAVVERQRKEEQHERGRQRRAQADLNFLAKQNAKEARLRDSAMPQDGVPNG